jgi:hypothetical protein
VRCDRRVIASGIERSATLRAFNSIPLTQKKTTSNINSPSRLSGIHTIKILRHSSTKAWQTSRWKFTGRQSLNPLQPATISLFREFKALWMDDSPDDWVGLCYLRQRLQAYIMWKLDSCWLSAHGGDKNLLIWVSITSPLQVPIRQISSVLRIDPTGWSILSLLRGKRYQGPVSLRR